MSIEYLAWRCTWQSSEAAASAAWENSAALYKQLQAANQRIAVLTDALQCMVNEFEQDAIGGVFEDGECHVIDKARAALGQIVVAHHEPE